MNLQDYIITEQEPIIGAMRLINENGRGIALVCEGLRLKGVVTDGNIRRYILKNGDLQAPVSCVTNVHPKTIGYQTDINPQEFMGQHGINAVPIVSSEGELRSIIFRDDKQVYQSRDLNIPVVIMAGGEGTRLQPFTRVLPKPLIPVGDKTITELIMEKFEQFGCRHFNMIVNYKKNLIKTYFAENESKHQVVFTEEASYGGTGGGLKLLEGQYDSTFFMSNCDIFIEEDYGEILRHHRERENLLTMVCAMNSTTIPYGIVEISGDGRVEALREKPMYSVLVNTGLYVIEPAFLRHIPSDVPIHITAAIEACLAAGERVGAYPISDSAWFDMGQLGALEQMKRRFAGGVE